MEIDKSDNEDEVKEENANLDSNKSDDENEEPTDANGQEYLYNEEAHEDENLNSNLLRNEVIAEQRSLLPDLIEGLDSNVDMEANIDTDNLDRWPEYCDPEYRMPGIINVSVTLDLEEHKFQVNIVKAVLNSKIYLGDAIFFL